MCSLDCNRRNILGHGEGLFYKYQELSDHCPGHLGLDTCALSKRKKKPSVSAEISESDDFKRYFLAKFLLK